MKIKVSQDFSLSILNMEMVPTQLFFFFSTDDPTVSRLTRCCTAHTVPAPQLNQLRDLL